MLSSWYARQARGLRAAESLLALYDGWGFKGLSSLETMFKDVGVGQFRTQSFSSVPPLSPHRESLPVGSQVRSTAAQGLPGDLLACLKSKRRNKLEDAVTAWYWRNLSEQVTQVAGIKDEVAAKTVELAGKRVEVAAKEVEIVGLKGQLQWVRARWLQVAGQFHARGLLEYLSEECYEAIGSPPPPHTPGGKPTRKDRLTAVLSDSAYKPLLDAINVSEPGSPGKVAGRLVGIYGVLSSHIHANYTPSEWQNSGDSLRIVEGPLTNRDCRILEAVCKHLCIPCEVYRLQHSLGDESSS